MQGASRLQPVLHYKLTVCPFVSALFLPVEKQSGKYVCVNVRFANYFPPPPLFFIHLCSIFVFKNAFRESEQEGDGPMN
jgi:hypothetical protein